MKYNTQWYNNNDHYITYLIVVFINKSQNIYIYIEYDNTSGTVNCGDLALIYSDKQQHLCIMSGIIYRGIISSYLYAPYTEEPLIPIGPFHEVLTSK